MIVKTHRIKSAGLVVSLDEVKRYLNILTHDWDALLTSLVGAAGDFVERHCNISLLTSTVTLSISKDVLGDTLFIRARPGVAVTSVQYYNASNVLTTMPTSSYEVIIKDNETTVEFYDSVVHYDRPDPIRVVYTFGYGAASTDVPDGLRWAITSIVAYWFLNREATVTGTIATQLPLHATAALALYRWEEI